MAELKREPAVNGRGFINPYNFVRLGEPAPRGLPATQEKFAGLSGRLVCEIEVLTPLALPDPEGAHPDPQVKAQKDEDIHLRKPFFTHQGEEIIPGSSIKGALRSVAEAVTGSCMSVMAVGRIVFRDNRSHAVDKRRLGRLIRQNDQWKMVDVNPDDGVSSGDNSRVAVWKERVRLYKDYRDKLFPAPKRKRPEPTSGVPAFTFRGKSYRWFDLLHGTFGDTNRRDVDETGRALVIREGRRVVKDMRPDPPTRSKGEPVTIRWPVADQRTSPAFDLAKETVEQYEEMIASPDFRRFHDKPVTDLKLWQEEYLAAKDKELYWYRRYESQKVAEFGRNFRYKWSYDPKAAIHEAFHPCHDVDQLCPVCALFGMAAPEGSSDVDVNALAGRIHIGPATKTAGQLQWIECLKILGTPKPSCRSFYLEPARGYIGSWNVAQEEFQSFDADSSRMLPTPVRGRKFYWHHLKNWKPGDLNYFRKLPPRHGDKPNEPVKSGQNASVQAAMPGSRFRFEIRFENLAEWELGLLLWTLTLPELNGKGAHHLGLGKPLGMGSVRLHLTQATVIERDERYKDPFSLGEETHTPVDLKEGQFKDAMKAFRRQVKTWGRGEQEFEKLPHVADLLTILDAAQPQIAGSEVQVQYPPGIGRKDVPGMNKAELHYTWFGGFKWSQRLLTIEEIKNGKRQQWE